MNAEQLRQNAAAIVAIADGKAVQWQSNSRLGLWVDCVTVGNIPSDIHCVPYRPKPAPLSRPWSKPEDVPGPVCWVRQTATPPNVEMMIVTVYHDGVRTCDSGSQPVNFTWFGLIGYSYSTDRETWHKCEVTE